VNPIVEPVALVENPEAGKGAEDEITKGITTSRDMAAAEKKAVSTSNSANTGGPSIDEANGNQTNEESKG